VRTLVSEQDSSDGGGLDALCRGVAARARIPRHAAMVRKGGKIGGKRRLVDLDPGRDVGYQIESDRRWQTVQPVVFGSLRFLREHKMPSRAASPEMAAGIWSANYCKGKASPPARVR
jgi:hypothetical protein